eukprot:5223831-Amphidinium_carterae.1
MKAVRARTSRKVERNSSDAIDAARHITENSQVEWMKGYCALQAELGEENLGVKVFGCSPGKIIREESWSSADWGTRKETSYWACSAGWWQERPLSDRCVALACCIPSRQLLMSFGEE